MTLSFRGSRRNAAVSLTAVLAVATMALAACGSDSDSDSSTPAASSSGSSSAGAADYGDISVQLSWIKNSEFAGEFTADDKGYYKDAGFSKVNLLSGPVAQEEIVATGKAQFGLSNAVSTAAAVANSGFPLKIVGATYQKNPFSILSLSNKGNIATPQDLCGKKIGVQDPNLSLFNAFLKVNHIDPSCLTIVPNSFDISPLEDGQIDGLVAYLTNESLLVKGDGYDTVNLPFADNNLPFVAETVITTDDMIANHADEVKAFLTAEIKGWNDACADEAGYKAGAALAVDTYGKAIDPPLELDKEVEQATTQCKALVKSDETDTNGLFTMSDQMIADNIASIKAAGINISADDLFDNSLINEVYAADPSLKG